MRRRILTVALSASVLAVVLLGVPLGFAIERNAVTQERGNLERAALQAAVVVSPDYRSGDPVELPDPGDGRQVGLYNPGGDRVSGTGPDTLEAQARTAVRGAVVDAATSSTYVEAVPVSVGERVIGIVRTSSAKSTVRSTVLRRVLGLAGLAALTLGLAAGFAFWQSRRLAALMHGLADAATQLGAGDFTVRPPPSGVLEIDRTRTALIETASRLREQIARERAFSARASHQLRTPLTQLRLELEAGLTQQALLTAEELSRTVDDVLAISRHPAQPATPFDVEALLSDLVPRWQGTLATDDRPLRLVIDDPPQPAASQIVVRQILQVLLDNAWRHGDGAVTVTARASGGVLALDVEDRGVGDVTWPTARATGSLGLAMARSLAESQDGRLILASEPTFTRFTLLVPSRSGDREP